MNKDLIKDKRKLYGIFGKYFSKIDEFTIDDYFEQYSFFLKPEVDLHILEEYGFDLDSSATLYNFFNCKDDLHVLYLDDNYGRIYLNGDTWGLCIRDNLGVNERYISYDFIDKNDIEIFIKMLNNNLINIYKREEK